MASKAIINEAKTFAKDHMPSLKNSIQAEDLLSDEDQKKQFDSAEAKNNLKKQTIPNTEVFQFATSQTVRENVANNKDFSEEEGFFERSESIANNDDLQEVNTETPIYTTETCRQAGDPYTISLTRSLHLDSTYDTENIAVCQGHQLTKKYKRKKQAHTKAKRKRKKILKDTSVTSCDYSIEEKKSKYKYVVTWQWSHIDNATTCDNFQNETRTKLDTFHITNEAWFFDDTTHLEHANSPQCTLIDQTCLDYANRTISGQNIQRQCWKERLYFLCLSDHKNECTYLKKRNCQEMSRKCIEKSPFGCSRWELTFQCISSTKRTTTSNQNDIFGLEEELWETAHVPNNSFAEVSTKLELFNQIRQEIANAQVFDASTIKLFSGEKTQCEKTIASDIIYDCCLSLSGLATQLNLAKCSSDEIKDIHVFCCFPSKLSRVFQEQAKKQLDIGWGSAKHPNCSGINVDDISKLNFSKLDLSEVYEESLRKTEDLDRKLENFQNRLREQLAKQKDSQHV